MPSKCPVAALMTRSFDRRKRFDAGYPRRAHVALESFRNQAGRSPAYLKSPRRLSAERSHCIAGGLAWRPDGLYGSEGDPGSLNVRVSVQVAGRALCEGGAGASVCSVMWPVVLARYIAMSALRMSWSRSGPSLSK